MTDRKQKIKELLESFQSLRRTMAFRVPGKSKIPRITPSQWSVLMFVEQRGGSTVKDVAKALGITSSATTQLIDGLVLSGYITKETPENDRRTIILSLSKKTQTQVERMKKEGLQRFLKLFESLNEREFNQYISLNKKLLESISLAKPSHIH